MEIHFKDARSIHSLVDLGTKGHYPLFPRPWLDQVFLQKNLKLNAKERVKAKKLIKQILEYRSLERKRTALSAMTDTDRELFIKAFFLLVEHKILDSKPELH